MDKNRRKKKSSRSIYNLLCKLRTEVKMIRKRASDIRKKKSRWNKNNERWKDRMGEREDQVKKRIPLAESTGKRRGILLASLRVKTKKEKDNERGKSEKSWEDYGIEGSKGRGRKDRGWNSECEWKEAYWELSVNRSKMLKRLDGPDERALGKMNNGDRRRSRNGAEVI